ncbi:MAG: oligosaccharide flippase family protein [Oscillospiraceae bacterium]|nr:oligosaccharide flippase family protein [Oscillospiraceae bacterium]
MKDKVIALKKKYVNLSSPVKASVWFTICNILNKSIALLSTPIFTRIMTTSEYGDYTVFQSWYALILIFSSLNLASGAYPKGLIEFEDDRKKFTSSVMGLSVFCTAIVFIVYLIGQKFWTELFGLAPVLIYAMFLKMLISPAYELWATQKRFAYEYKSLVTLSLSSTILSVVVATIAVLNLPNFRLFARVFSDVGVNVVLCLPILILLFVRGKQKINFKYWKYALRFNLPLIPHFLSMMVLNQADRIMIKSLDSSSHAAMYGIAYTIGTVAILVVTAINNSFVPYVYTSIKDKQYGNIKKNANLLIIFVAGIVVVSMIFAPEIIYIFAGKQYTDAIGIVPPIAVSVFLIFMYSVFSNVEYYYKKTTYIAVASVICSIANIGLNYVFILKFGYYAAGYTTLFCYILLAIFHLFFCNRILKNEKIPINSVFDLRFYAVVLIGMLTLMLFMIATYNYFWIRYLILLLIFVFAIIYRRKLMEIIKSVKR